MLRICVCVPTFNRPAQVAALLANLAKQDEPPDEVVIVDASPNEETKVVADTFAGAFRSFKYERHQKGLTRQRNRAIEVATGDVVVFLDDDVVLQEDFLKETKRILQEDKGGVIAGLTGVVTNQRRRSSGAGWRFKRRCGIIESDQAGKLLASGETTPLPVPEGGKIVEVDYLPGGITAWRSTIFDRYRFSHFFASYGLGEDKYFSGCVALRHRLFVSGDLRAEHHHTPGNRPDAFRWGYANVVNHYFIMRECSRGQLRRLRFFLFHTIDASNELLSWPFRKDGIRRLAYGLGRTVGIARCILLPPRMTEDDPARDNQE